MRGADEWENLGLVGSRTCRDSKVGDRRGRTEEERWWRRLMPLHERCCPTQDHRYLQRHSVVITAGWSATGSTEVGPLVSHHHAGRLRWLLQYGRMFVQLSESVGGRMQVLVWSRPQCWVVRIHFRKGSRGGERARAHRGPSITGRPSSEERDE